MSSHSRNWSLVTICGSVSLHGLQYSDNDLAFRILRITARVCLHVFILFYFIFLNHLRSLDTASLTELCESICIAGKLKKMRLLAGFIFTTFFLFFFFPHEGTLPSHF